MNCFEELKEIVRNQKTVRTSRLARIEKDIDRIRMKQQKQINDLNKRLQESNNENHRLVRKYGKSL